VKRGVFPNSRLIQTFLKPYVSGKSSSLATSSFQNTIIQNLSFFKLLETLEDVKARNVNFHRYSSAFQDYSMRNTGNKWHINSQQMQVSNVKDPTTTLC
jgi:hypothetical protein